MDALVPMVLGTNMLVGGLALIFVFKYASREIKQDSIWMKGNHLNIYGFCLKFMAPVVLGIILLGNLSLEFQVFDFGKGIRWLWFVLALFAAYQLTRISNSKKNV